MSSSRPPHPVVRQRLHHVHAGDGKRIELHPAEKTLVALIIVQLAFWAWANGGLRLWSHWIGCSLAVVAFIVALWPRHYTEANSRQGRFHLTMWPRLLRFPLFWAGLLLLAYITIQGFNPAWTWMANEKGAWWMQRIPHVEWLPHGTISPLKMGNPLSGLMIYGAGWLTLCAIWVGVTRRRSLQIILYGIAANALLLAGLAIAQRLTGTDKILWFQESPNQIWATFFYRNHGGAWFNLMVAVFCALACWHYLRGLRTFAKSSPAPVLGFLSLLMTVTVIVSYSRGAVLALLVFLGLFLVFFLLRQFSLPNYPQKHLVTAVLLLAFAGFAFIGLRGLDAKKTWDRMEALFAGKTTSLVARQIATKATFDMWRASPWLGHGADSFQFIFPLYQQNHPEIWSQQRWDKRQQKLVEGRRFFWQNAHNDFAQILAELGVVGVAPIVFGLLWGAWHCVRRRAWGNPMVVVPLLGLLVVLLHSWGEFVFQCPAILIMWLALGGIALHWAELEAPAQSR